MYCCRAPIVFAVDWEPVQVEDDGFECGQMLVMLLNKWSFVCSRVDIMRVCRFDPRHQTIVRVLRER